MSDKPLTYTEFFGAAREGLKLGPDRHPKWQRVEPGTVIPAGQPFRTERPGDHYCIATEYIRDCDQRVKDDGTHVFIDSSWKPPLVLPTEPTWGIAVHLTSGEMLGVWAAVSTTAFQRMNVAAEVHRDNVIDFIPLTDEQIARIEAAR